MKISEMMEVFQAGKQVANPAFCKQHTINANVLMVLISGIVGVMNMFDCSICDLQLSSEQLIGLATGITTIAGILNVGSTLVTSTKVGVSLSKGVHTHEETIAPDINTDKILVENDLSNDIKDLQ